MGKEEFLRELGGMFNDTSGEIPRTVGNNSNAKPKPASKIESGIEVSKHLGNLEKELKSLKQQVESMKSGMREVINLQKKTPTIPTHRHAELEESIEKLQGIPAHSHTDLQEAISDLLRRSGEHKALKNILDEHETRIDNLETTKEDKKKGDNRPFMAKFIP